MIQSSSFFGYHDGPMKVRNFMDVLETQGNEIQHQHFFCIIFGWKMLLVSTWRPIDGG